MTAPTLSPALLTDEEIYALATDHGILDGPLSASDAAYFARGVEAAVLARSSPAPSAPTPDLEPEDADERAMFDKGMKLTGGDVRAHMAHMLRIWAVVHPGGSYAAQCHIMANEIVKLSAAAPTAATADSAEMVVLRELVACKDLRKTLPDLAAKASAIPWAQANDDYKRRMPAAWSRARALASPCPPLQQPCKPQHECNDPLLCASMQRCQRRYLDEEETRLKQERNHG